MKDQTLENWKKRWTKQSLNYFFQKKLYMMKNINEKNNLHVFSFASALGLFYRMIQ